MLKTLTAFIATASAATTAGFGGSITAGGLNNAKNIIVPYVFAAIAEV